VQSTPRPIPGAERVPGLPLARLMAAMNDRDVRLDASPEEPVEKAMLGYERAWLPCRDQRDVDDLSVIQAMGGQLRQWMAEVADQRVGGVGGRGARSSPVSSIATAYPLNLAGIFPARSAVRASTSTLMQGSPSHWPMATPTTPGSAITRSARSRCASSMLVCIVRPGPYSLAPSLGPGASAARATRSDAVRTPRNLLTVDRDTESPQHGADQRREKGPRSYQSEHACSSFA